MAALGGHCRGVGLVWSPAGARLAEEPRLRPGLQTQSSLCTWALSHAAGLCGGSLYTAVTSLRLAWGGLAYSVHGPLTLDRPGPPLPCPAVHVQMWPPRGWQWQLGPERFPETERAAGAKAHHALGCRLDPRPAFLSGPKPRWRRRSETSLLTPGVPSPLVPLPSYIRPVSPLSSRRGPRGWESRGASSVPVREPRGKRTIGRASRRPVPWLSRPALVGRICRSSTPSLPSWAPVPLSSPPLPVSTLAVGEHPGEGATARRWSSGVSAVHRRGGPRPVGSPVGLPAGGPRPSYSATLASSAAGCQFGGGGGEAPPGSRAGLWGWERRQCTRCTRMLTRTSVSGGPLCAPLCPLQARCPGGRRVAAEVETRL